jgi:hypothetical protein
MRVQTDWALIFSNHMKMVWFVVRYSCGAVHPGEVERWSLPRLREAHNHLNFWLKTENKNSKA